jgi:hypothetical protein
LKGIGGQTDEVAATTLRETYLPQLSVAANERKEPRAMKLRSSMILDGLIPVPKYDGGHGDASGAADVVRDRQYYSYKHYEYYCATIGVTTAQHRLADFTRVIDAGTIDFRRLAILQGFVPSLSYF